MEDLIDREITARGKRHVVISLQDLSRSKRYGPEPELIATSRNECFSGSLSPAINIPPGTPCEHERFFEKRERVEEGEKGNSPSGSTVSRRRYFSRAYVDAIYIPAPTVAGSTTGSPTTN